MGVTALVGIALASAAALTSGGLGTALERSLARGVCLVTGERCAAVSAATIPTDLEPCPLERREQIGDLSLDVGVVRLAARLGLSLVRSSDGKVRVSFADEGRVGVGAAVGAHIQVGRLGGTAEASVDGGLALTAGRVWLLPNRAAAERFVARFGDSQRLAGRLEARPRSRSARSAQRSQANPRHRPLRTSDGSREAHTRARRSRSRPALPSPGWKARSAEPSAGEWGGTGPHGSSGSMIG